MLVTRRVVNLDLDLLLLHILDALVDVEDGRLVYVSVGVVQVVGDHARLAHGGVARQHQLERFLTGLVLAVAAFRHTSIGGGGLIAGVFRRLTAACGIILACIIWLLYYGLFFFLFFFLDLF